MSTICKIDPMVRQRRAYRAALLRMRPRTAEALVVLFELRKIQKNPRLTGAKKHELFVRGAQQIHQVSQ